MQAIVGAGPPPTTKARARTLAHAIGSAAAERYRETTLPAGTAHTHTHVAMLLALYAAKELGGFDVQTTKGCLIF